MRERPILFSAPMVRAVLSGSKTQTRRSVRPQPVGLPPDGYRMGDVLQAPNGKPISCPYGLADGRLWVREAWRADLYDDSTQYRATHPSPDGVKWKPSIHMPRLRSRITLEVIGVRVERLQDISEDDAIAEGVRNLSLVVEEYGIGEMRAATPSSAYMKLWESINGPGSWNANPWVWVIEFRKAAS